MLAASGSDCGHQKANPHGDSQHQQWPVFDLRRQPAGSTVAQSRRLASDARGFTSDRTRAATKPIENFRDRRSDHVSNPIRALYDGGGEIRCGPICRRAQPIEPPLQRMNPPLDIGGIHQARIG